MFDEILDLYAISLHPPRVEWVEWVDGFDGMEAVVRYLKDRADREHSYSVADIGGTIRAVAFFSGDKLLLLTSGGEVVHDRKAGG